MALLTHRPWPEALFVVYQPQTSDTDEPAQSAEVSQNGSTLIVIWEEVQTRAVAMRALIILTIRKNNL